MKQIKLKTQEEKEMVESIKEKMCKINTMKSELDIEMVTFWSKFNAIHGHSRYKMWNNGEIWEIEPKDELKELK